MTNRKGVEDASSSGSENQRQGRSGGVSVGDLKPLQPSERIRRRKRPATQLLALRVRKVVRISPRKSKHTRQRDGTHFAYCSSSNCVFANGKNEHSNLGREQLEESIADLPNGRELQPEKLKIKAESESQVAISFRSDFRMSKQHFPEKKRDSGRGKSPSGAAEIFNDLVRL